MSIADTGFFDFFCKKAGSSTVCATLELGLAKTRRRNIKLPVLWERGAFRRPHVPSRAERRLRDNGWRRRWRLRLRYALRLPRIRSCGVRTCRCAVCKWFPQKVTVQRRFAARTCRIRSARLLAASLPPLRALFWARRDSPPLPAHGRCRPVTPAFLLFA